jgi:FkbM family methyltransferase
VFYHRVQSFLYRVIWLSKLSGNPFKSIFFWIKASDDNYEVMSLRILGTSFQFRAIDANVIEEIFINHEYDFVAEKISPIKKPLIIDVGAHIGAFAVWVFQNNSLSDIVSVEADPDTFNLLSINKKSFKKYSWRVHNLAAWSVNDIELKFSQRGGSISHRVSNDGELLVTSTTLKNIIEYNNLSNRCIDLLKIDIEGSEEEFLCEKHEVLKNVKYLIIELHPYLCNTERVIEVLNKYFDSIVKINNRASSKPLLFCQ